MAPRHALLLRSAAMVALASAATANHLAGPMQDRMYACIDAMCSEFGEFNTAPDFNGLGMSFAVFTSPPMNSVPFIYDMPYALSVIGYTNNSYNYRAAAGEPQNLTTFPQENLTSIFLCMCQNCASTLEPIFQPIGRSICSALGHDLPCADEFDACTAANGFGTGATGSLAGKDLVYPSISPGNPNRSASVCHPEATFMGYKVGYNLTSECNADGTALTAGGGPTALDLAKCLSRSRINAFNASMNCLDVGGADCGEPYNCTYVPPAPAPEQESAGPSKSSTAQAKASFALALVSLLFAWTK